MSLKNKNFAVAWAVFALFSGAAPIQAQPAGDATAIEALDQALRPHVMPPSGPFRPDQIDVAQAAAIAAWARSGHSDATSESFAHWNDEGEIPPVCATCHAGAGFRSFHGLDGSAPGLPEHPVPTGGVVDCQTCHNPGLSAVTEVRLPSGVMHPVTPGEAPCMTCHQGRAAGSTVTSATADKPEDTPDPALAFINPHYAVAAATWLGGYGGGGYQYPGKSYSGRFFHARPVASCVSCHDPHSLQVAEETCLTCHEQSRPRDIRISRQSHDGSGDLSRGIHADITANAARLHGLLGEYAAQIAGKPLVHDGQRHPYFFADANGDGRADQVEGRPLPYDAWTPRLLKAAYNWKFVASDPGIFAHNPHYALELLYDSAEDLATALGRDIAQTGMRR